ncbi:hypothetical protein [Flavobacterium salmonis]|uniref:Uncharacterized protein n=1 Tax=Flavobacterium salmonis TaxID=2654844 RepID=A0A6V6Z1D2_9FLAO|nr:hypothetical protein [Flavobacterium salmonis]CAD0005570.1 hypothetical protein FLAT13_02848 [Flavobacterium salmonis]
MGIFDIFKSKNQNENEAKFKNIGIDNVYLIDIPEDWTQYKSDRFRAINKTKSINFSITNYGKSLDPKNPFTLDKLKAETFELFQKFVTEGGYEPIDDREANNNYVYQAFKVDNETQYYYYTSRERMGQLIRIVFILKQNGIYKASTKNLLLAIGDSIKTKVA